MPRKPHNKRVTELRTIRNRRIRECFDMHFEKGLRYEIVLEILIEEFGLCESTLAQIIKKQGIYKD